MQSRWVQLTVVLSLSAAAAFGQYPAGTSPGGYHSSTGIAIGAGAAAGVGIGYLVLHNHNRGKVTGCLQSAGNAGMLLDDNKKNSYALINPDAVTLKTGERVELRGKRIQQGSGTFAFEVRGLVKDYGQCQQ
jgi:hypothetical protein